jgi:hypothetical protein
MAKKYGSLLMTLVLLSGSVAPIANLSAGTSFNSTAVALSVKQAINNSLVIQSAYAISPAPATTGTGYTGNASSNVVITDATSTGTRIIVAYFTNDSTKGFDGTTDTLTLQAINTAGSPFISPPAPVSIFPTLSATGIVQYAGTLTNKSFILQANYSGTQAANFTNIKIGQLTLTSQDGTNPAN